MEKQQQPEHSRLPQKKLKIVDFKRKKRVSFMLPHETEMKRNPCSPQGADKEMFKCECNYCQRCGGTTSGIPPNSSRKEAISHLPRCEKLTLGMNNLTLKPHTLQIRIVPENIHRIENRMQWHRKSKRMFQRFLHERSKCLWGCHHCVEEDHNSQHHGQ